MLGTLFEELSKIEGLERIRLSSIEPTDVTDELIEAMRTFPEACPHLHIPLQSGDDFILERMNRRYRRQFFIELVKKLKERFSDFVLTTDVMVGFPGEGEAHFEQTIQTLLETQPYKLHIFPYSKREGTRAERFQNEIASTEVNRRKTALFSIEEKMRRQVERDFIGKTMDLLLEEGETEEGWLSGRGANYIKAYIWKQGSCRERGMIRIRLEEQQRDGRLIGRECQTGRGVL